MRWPRVNAMGAMKLSPAPYLKTFTSTFSRPSILSSSFSMDPMRLRAAWENIANLAGVGSRQQSKHADSAQEVMHLMCSNARQSCRFTACVHCRQEECADAYNAAATQTPCESYRCQPGHHEQGQAWLTSSLGLIFVHVYRSRSKHSSFMIGGMSCPLKIQNPLCNCEKP